MSGFKDWDQTTPANNASVGSVIWTEGQLPSTVNDSARQLMTDLRLGLGGTEQTISAASLTNIASVESNNIVIQGTDDINDFGVIAAGIQKTLRIADGLTINHSAGAIQMPDSNAFSAAAGTHIQVVSDGSGQWRVFGYTTTTGVGGEVTTTNSVSIENKSMQSSNSYSGGTFTLPTVNNPTISGGTYSGGSLTAATLAAPTVNDATINTPTVSAGTLTSSTLASPVINGTITGDAFLDEDNMASDSATKVASQQSIKKYVDDNSGAFTDGTPQTPTAAASVDFTSIPTTVKRVTVVFDGMDPSGGSGSDDLECRIGDSGGFEATGYLGSGITDSHKVGTTNSGGVDVYNGVIELRRLSSASNTWIFVSHCYNEDGGGTDRLTSSKTLSGGALDRIQLLWTSGGNFVASGTVNIQYE